MLGGARFTPPNAICLQETKLQDRIDVNINRFRVICTLHQLKHDSNKPILTHFFYTILFEMYSLIFVDICIVSHKSENLRQKNKCPTSV